MSEWHFLHVVLLTAAVVFGAAVGLSLFFAVHHETRGRRKALPEPDYSGGVPPHRPEPRG